MCSTEVFFDDVCRYIYRKIYLNSCIRGVEILWVVWINLQCCRQRPITMHETHLKGTQMPSISRPVSITSPVEETDHCCYDNNSSFLINLNILWLKRGSYAILGYLAAGSSPPFVGLLQMWQNRSDQRSETVPVISSLSITSLLSPVLLYVNCRWILNHRKRDESLFTKAPNIWIRILGWYIFVKHQTIMAK